MPFDQQNFEPTPSDEVLARLIAGRDRIADPVRWTRGALMRDATDDGPAAMCARGAIFCGFSATAREIYAAADDALFRRLPMRFQTMRDARFAGVPSFNNDPSTTHADVLALFDRAIAARKAEMRIGTPADLGCAVL